MIRKILKKFGICWHEFYHSTIDIPFSEKSKQASGYLDHLQFMTARYRICYHCGIQEIKLPMNSRRSRWTKYVRNMELTTKADHE